MKRGFLSQKKSGVGRGVKEKQVSTGVKSVDRTKSITDAGTNLMGLLMMLIHLRRCGTEPTTQEANSAGNAPGKPSYATATSKRNEKKVNVRTLFTPGGKGIDVVVSVDFIRAISARFANTAYGFFLRKKVAYPVVVNYVRNIWSKYGLVRLMFNSSTELFSFQFSSMDGLDAMLENGPWFIRNNPLILKKWHSDENLLKEDVRLFCSSYARVMVELRADVELKNNIVVAMPKITREGHYTCNDTDAGEKKTVKKPSQTFQGVPVGPKWVLNLKKNIDLFPKSLMLLSGSTFMNIDNDEEFASNTHIGEKIDKIERQIDEGKLRLLDNDENPLVPTDGSNKGYGTNSLLEQWRDSYPDNNDYDPYDDDMYENHDLSEHLQFTCEILISRSVSGRRNRFFYVWKHLALRMRIHLLWNFNQLDIVLSLDKESKGSGVGRGVKEKQVSTGVKSVDRTKSITDAGIGLFAKSNGTLNDTNSLKDVVSPSVINEHVAMEVQNSLVAQTYSVQSHVVEETVAMECLVVNTSDVGPNPLRRKLIQLVMLPNVAYLVVANYVRNTWDKYGLVRSMFSSSTGLFSFQFSSMDGLDAMLENDPWFIRNNPLTLKKWHPDENLLKENVSQHARVMVELRADVELKDNIVVVMPKIIREGHYTCNDTGAGEKNTVKKPSRTFQGVPVGPKIDFKPQKEYRPVPKKLNASSSGNKKKGVEPLLRGTTNLVNNGATSSGSSFMNIDNDGEFASNTPIGIVVSDSEVELVFDETANLRISTSGKDESNKGYGTNSLLEQ
uniref:DUF4283 domain-containing protein n=1 Tax=Tanacetum cinerariifolium TaxID=118510 RepID=A0A6L2LMG1_TANCI|nr:hypothetical protein [Tanacetum cinerariifolium]